MSLWRYAQDARQRGFFLVKRVPVLNGANRPSNGTADADADSDSETDEDETGSDQARRLPLACGTAGPIRERLLRKHGCPGPIHLLR